MNEEVNQLLGEEPTDFVVETEGHCFLCLKETMVLESGSESATLSTLSSLQYLFNYLRLDLSKLIRTEVCQSDSTKVKVSLCEGCALLNDRFSELCGQLERIRMEVEHCLGGIHGKLRQAEGGWRRLKVKSRSGDGDRDRALQIAEELRCQTLEKCSLKLHRRQPRVLLRKLKRDTRATYRPEEDLLAMSVLHQAVSSSASVKLEGEQVNLKVGEDDMTCDPDGALGTPHSDSDPSAYDVKQEMDEIKVKMEKPEPPSLSVKPRLRRNAAPRSRKTTHRNWSFNAGKYQCNTCRQKFNCRSSWNNHNQTSHLKVRYECPICHKEFSQASTLGQHHKSVHLGRRFRCRTCGEISPKRRDILVHQWKSEGACRVGKDEVVEVRVTDADRMTRLGRQGKVSAPAPAHLLEANPSPLSVWQCDDCGEKFTSTDHLHSHQESAHPEVPVRGILAATEKYQCSICGKVFRFKSNWANHYKGVHQKLRHKCSICDKDFSQTNTLRIHNKKFHLGRRYRCRTCGKVSIKRWHIQDHQRQSGGACPEGKDEVEVLTTAENRSEKKITPDMGEGLGTELEQVDPQTSLEPRHLISQNFNFIAGLMKYECKICQKSFNSKATSLKHFRGVHQKLRYKCPICNKLFSQPGSVAIHRKRVHLGMRYRCRTCGEISYRRKNIEVHQLKSRGACRAGRDEVEVISKTNLKPLIVGSDAGKRPGKKITTAGGLQSHQESGSSGLGGAPPVWMCQDCGKILPTESGLKSHRRNLDLGLPCTTAGLMKHQCDICGKVFKARSNLREHHRSAHQKLRFKCPICDKEFSQASAIGRHRRDVHLGMRFKCRTCDKVSNKRCHILTHQRQSGGACPEGKDEVEVVRRTENASDENNLRLSS